MPYLVPQTQILSRQPPAVAAQSGEYPVLSSAKHSRRELREIPQGQSVRLPGSTHGTMFRENLS